MALSTFTAGQVLTAAQVNAVQANDYNQTVSTKTVSYVLVAADKGTRVVMNAAGATTITVNTSLFAAGDTLFIQNIGAGACTITAGTATVSTSSSLVLAQYQGGTLYFTSTGVAIFFLVGSAGASALKDADISGTTGSPVTTSYTNGSINYKSYKFTGSGSITFSKAGLVDVLCVAEGGLAGFANYAGGAGGMIVRPSLYVTAGAQICTVGSGSSGSLTHGAASNFGNILFAIGGGACAVNISPFFAFGGSGGSTNNGSLTGSNVAGQGNIGTNSASSAGGGGAGGAASGATGGVGLANDYATGSNITYATGGSATGTSGAANTGNGASATTGGNTGGSGVIVIRVLA